MTEALVDVRRPTDRVILLPSTKPYYGLGSILSDRVANHVHRYWMVSDRIAVLQLKLSKQVKVAFTNVYAPHMRPSAEQSDGFYDTLQETIQRFRHQLLFILGDFNAKIGQRCEGETFLGLYSRGYRNDNGIRLRDFCAENDLFLSNTAFYKKRARNITTWQGISGRGPIFNQIDYIILPLRFKLLLSNSQSWSGTLVDSDHRLINTNLQLSNVYKILMNISRTQPSALTFDTALLQDPDIFDLYQQSIAKALVAPAPTESLEWPSVLIRIKAIANTIIRPKIDTVQRPDDNDEIAAHSRAQKRLRALSTSSNDPVDQLLYRSRRQALLRTIRQKCKEAGRLRVTQHIMDLKKYKYTERMYHIIRRLTTRKRPAKFIRDHDGRIIGNSRETAQVITEFLSGQFHKPHLSDVYVGTYSMKYPITAEEVTQTFRSLKNNRAPGADHIPAELLKYSPPVVPISSLEQSIVTSRTPQHPCAKALIMVLSSPFRSLTNRRAAVPTFDRSPYSAPLVRPYPRSS